MTWGRRRSTPRRIALSSGPVVFAVEDTTVQLTWRTLPVGPVRFVTDRSRVEVESDGGPGAVVLDRLDPATDGAVVVQTTEGSLDVPFRTLASPPGAELFRFATISDVHLGKSTFGLRHTISEPEVDEAHPIRCARSALVDLTAWGGRATGRQGRPRRRQPRVGVGTRFGPVNRVTVGAHAASRQPRTRPRRPGGIRPCPAAWSGVGERGRDARYPGPSDRRDELGDRGSRCRSVGAPP